ncbi:hypothetical protein EA772_01415 [Pedobacter sp. G11]|uniref:hypothetical protein n=1 Tax=Pedobacter sp. G11 TaxID=2482728 RepID=UPI000F5EE740|nr:hypothetical protein [Pedobacter sp. G11]AZI24064.1 hypothetical protein EA772_01415 [Pedobacter sp. G11]
MVTLLGGIIMVLGMMFYQDLKYRGIYWWLFPLLFLGLFAHSVFVSGCMNVLMISLWNSSFVLLQVFLLTLYISFRKWKLTNIFEGYFGIGDLLFLISIACAFSVVNYVMFYIVSLLLCILLTLLLKYNKNHSGEKIPLAGYQSLMLIGVLLFDKCQSEWKMVSDFSMVSGWGRW